MKKIIASIAAIIIAGGAALYLSQTVIKYNSMKNYCIHIDEHFEEYPYETEQAPEDFNEYSVKDVSFRAPMELSHI